MEKGRSGNGGQRSGERGAQGREKRITEYVEEERTEEEKGGN